jgi:hypothetical protein
LAFSPTDGRSTWTSWVMNLLLVTTCIILHNFLSIKYPSVQNRQLDSEDASHNIIPGEWRRGRNMTDIENVVAPNTGSLKAKIMWLYLKHYLNSAAGSVAWQNNMVWHFKTVTFQKHGLCFNQKKFLYSAS